MLLKIKPWTSLSLVKLMIMTGVRIHNDLDWHPSRNYWNYTEVTQYTPESKLFDVLDDDWKKNNYGADRVTIPNKLINIFYNFLYWVCSEDALLLLRLNLLIPSRHFKSCLASVLWKVIIKVPTTLSRNLKVNI